MPKFDYSDIKDPASIDPDRLPLGTGIQDCSLITSIYERGCHSTPTEAAVFATLTRSIQNQKTFSQTAINALTQYVYSPEQSAREVSAQGLSSGTQAPIQTNLRELNLGDQQLSTIGGRDFGDRLLSFLKDCIPCDPRVLSLGEIQPNLNLLSALEDQIKTQLAQLSGVLDLLNNFDAYTDFCELLGLLSFMCIPDLQRMIAILMALLTLDIPEFDGLIGMLQALIMPIFSPILMQITSMLDQFVLLVTNPIQCVIDAINEQLKKVGYQVELDKQVRDQLSSSLSLLQTMLVEAKRRIESRLDFYIQQVEAMLGEFNTGDSAYLKASLRKLQIVRMVSFIVAVINAISSGQLVCNPSQPPEVSQLDNFFENFLNPSSSFKLWVDDEGEIHVDLNDLDLPGVNNVIQFEGDPLLDTSIVESIQDVSQNLSRAVQVKVPCRLEATSDNVEQINRWIEELNQA